MISSTIAWGSSLRGLSEVTITTSAPSAGDGAHERTLAVIAIAAAPEDADHAARRQLPRRAQGGLQRVGRMRVVDDDGERLSLLDRLETPRDAAHRLDPADDRLVRKLEQSCHGDGRQDVLDVEAAEQACPERDACRR